MSSEDDVRKELDHLQRELNTVIKQVGMLERSISTLQANEAAMKETLRLLNLVITGVDGKNGLKGSVDRLIMLLDGDDTRDVDGVRKRLELTEKQLDGLINQRNMIKWALIGMGVTSLTNAGALITILSKVLGLK